MKFIDLSKEDRTDVLDRVSTELNIRQREVIEKDWWVTSSPSSHVQSAIRSTFVFQGRHIVEQVLAFG